MDDEKTQEMKDAEVFEALVNAYTLALHNRPNDRSDKDKTYSITLTDLKSRVIANFHTYVISGLNLE